MSVPVGLIVLWQGDPAAPPANWNVCDGTGTTPDLRERFIRGTPGGGVVGAVGGADSHTHTTTAAGAHSHSGATLTHSSHLHACSNHGNHGHGDVQLIAGTSSAMAAYTGAHNPNCTAATAGDHTAITADANHTHTINSGDAKPPYNEVVFLQAGAGASIVNGLIILWTGTIDGPNTIPGGWKLVAGLLGKYVRGWRAGIALGSGGATTHEHTVQDRAVHNHGGSIVAGSSGHVHAVSHNWPSHNHDYASYIDITGTSGCRLASSVTASHNHSNSGNSSHTHTIGNDGLHNHSAGTADNNPKHRTVAFIEADGATSFPANGVAVWMTDTPPASYEEVTELRDRLIKCVVNDATNPDLSTDAGSADHKHIEGADAGGHNSHAIQTTTHTHTATGSAGDHTHSVTAAGGYSPLGEAGSNTNSSGGAHTHTLVADSGHTHALGAADGAHRHNDWSDEGSLPASVNVMFVRLKEATDVPTRFQLTVQGFTDIATRFLLHARGYADVASRFLLHARDYADVATRFLLSPLNFTDVPTRFLLHARDYADVASRFLLTVRNYADVATRFLLTAQNFTDVATRFQLVARNFADVASRFLLTVRNYADVATRFLLAARNFTDVPTRFQLVARNFADTATRFLLHARSYVDIPTRFQLIAQNFTDVPTRFVLHARNYIDTATRFLLSVRNFTDVPTRFQLIVQNFTDIATLFRLVVLQHVDIRSRFLLILQPFVDVATRFHLELQVYRDVGTRFFLYAPTWYELKLEQEIGDLRAQLRKAHFKI